MSLLFLPPGLLGGGFLAPEYLGGEAGSEESVILFTDQLATFIAAQLGTYAYPDALPSRETVYPLLSYTVVTGDNLMKLSGASGKAWITIQLDSYSQTSFEAGSLSERLRRLFQDFNGQLGEIEVSNCLVSRPRSSYTPSPTGTDVGIYRLSRDFKFWFEQ